METVGAQAGSVDVSFNLISRGECSELPSSTLEGGRIAEITTFGTSLFPAFGLPPTL